LDQTYDKYRRLLFWAARIKFVIFKIKIFIINPTLERKERLQQSIQFIGLFREPVDWKTLNIPDYLEVIKHPMDLGTVRSKLNRGDYSSSMDCVNDIRLIWRNCMAYNSVNIYICVGRVIIVIV